jgi:hypothetical protein
MLICRINILHEPKVYCNPALLRWRWPNQELEAGPWRFKCCVLLLVVSSTVDRFQGGQPKGEKATRSRIQDLLDVHKPPLVFYMIFFLSAIACCFMVGRPWRHQQTIHATSAEGTDPSTANSTSNNILKKYSPKIDFPTSAKYIGRHKKTITLTVSKISRLKDVR